MKISIITATWNSGTTIRNTIESVLSQDYPDFEHIIIDGMSKDNTIDIVKEYEPKYNGRLIYISEKDNGIYDAMNKGIRMATGDVIGILNSDDFYTTNFILSQINKSFKLVDVIYGDVHYVDGNNLKKCVRYYSSKGFKFWQMRLGFMPPHASFYCKANVYNDCGEYDITLKSAADFDIVLRILKKGYKTKYVPLDFVTMRTGGMSTSGLKSYKRTIDETLKSLRKNGIYSNYILLLIKCAYKYIKLKL